MFCPNCGADVTDDTVFCEKCGARVVPDAKPVCAACGHELMPGARFCTACGAEQPELPSEVPETVSEPVPEEIPEEIPEKPTKDTKKQESPAEPKVPEMTRCPFCGREIMAGSVFCSACGAILNGTVPPYGYLPRKKKKGWLIFFIILLLLIAGAVAAWYEIPAVRETVHQFAVSHIFPQETEPEVLPTLPEPAAEETVPESTYDPSADYDAACRMVEDQKYDEALELFRSLGDYSDSAQKVQELTALQADYQRAQDFLSGHEFDKASKAFEELKDYRDSQEMARQGVRYARAEFLKQSVQDGDVSVLETVMDQENIYDSAAAALTAVTNYCMSEFRTLGTYQDAPAQLQECYQLMEDLLLRQMPEAAAEETADALFLDALKELIPLDLSEDYPAFQEKAQALLTPLQEKEFEDRGLRRIFSIYTDTLFEDAYWESHDLQDFPCELAKSAMIRFDLIDDLQDDYDFLKDSPDLSAQIDDMDDLYAFQYDISRLIREKLRDEPQVEDGKTYFTLKNPTETPFRLGMRKINTSDFTAGEWIWYDVPAQGDAYIYIEIPSEDSEAGWIYDWTIRDVVLD